MNKENSIKEKIPEFQEKIIASVRSKRDDDGKTLPKFIKNEISKHVKILNKNYTKYLKYYLIPLEGDPLNLWKKSDIFHELKDELLELKNLVKKKGVSKKQRQLYIEALDSVVDIISQVKKGESMKGFVIKTEELSDYLEGIIENIEGDVNFFEICFEYDKVFEVISKNQ